MAYVNILGESSLLVLGHMCVYILISTLEPGVACKILSGIPLLCDSDLPCVLGEHFFAWLPLPTLSSLFSSFLALPSAYLALPSFSTWHSETLLSLTYTFTLDLFHLKCSVTEA